MIEKAGTVVVIGGGPSLTPEQVEMCRGRARVVAVKEAAQLAPWADAMYFCDEHWFRKHENEVKNFKGMKATLAHPALLAEVPGLVSYRNDGELGLCEAPDGLRHGHNSGYQAINFAFHLKARLIVLLGMDMNKKDGRMHWFDRKVCQPIEMYQSVMLPCFKTLIEPLAAHGVRVVNATPGSAIDCFPKMALEEALCIA